MQPYAYRILIFVEIAGYDANIREMSKNRLQAIYYLNFHYTCLFVNGIFMRSRGNQNQIVENFYFFYFLGIKYRLTW